MFGGICITPVTGSTGLAKANPIATGLVSAHDTAVLAASRIRLITASLPSNSEVSVTPLANIVADSFTTAYLKLVPPISIAITNLDKLI